MTQITFRPTNVQNFGAPGTLFEAASKSLSRATSGFEDTLDTYSKGLQKEQDRRAKLAFADIEAANSMDAYNSLKNELNDPETIKNRYQVKDPTAIMAALREQEYDVRDTETKNYKYQNLLENRADQELLDKYRTQIGSVTDLKELEGLRANADQFNNPDLYLNLLKEQQGNLRGDIRFGQEQQKFGLQNQIDNLNLSNLRAEQAATQKELEYEKKAGEIYTANEGQSMNKINNLMIEAKIPSKFAANFLSNTAKATDEKRHQQLEDTAKKDISNFLAEMDKKDDRLGFSTSSHQEATQAIEALKAENLNNQQIRDFLAPFQDDDDFENSEFKKAFRKFRLKNDSNNNVGTDLERAIEALRQGNRG